MGYERFQAMTAPARAGAALWRTAVGAVASAALYVGSIYVVAGVLAALDPSYRLLDAFARGDTPAGAILLLLSFVFMAAGPILLARPLHFRGWRTLVGPSGQATWDFLLTVRALALLTVALWLLLPATFELDRGLKSGTWIALLPLTLLAIFVQSAAEEVAFRGYLQSQLAARFRSPLVWMVVPSALFAAGHYVPADSGQNAPGFALLAFAFGVAAADLTARTGSLGAAMGFHFANNVIALAITAMPGTMSGLALYTYPFTADDPVAMRPVMWLDLGIIALSWLATRVALRR